MGKEEANEQFRESRDAVLQSKSRKRKDVVEKEEEDEAATKNERNNNPSRRSDHSRRHVLTNGIQN